jgi:2-amino-4-hydroxy-6-hydroxymethyldihydropteridine diphosphokinase
MILVALGANLSNPAIGSPRDACERALDCLSDRDVMVQARSRWYRSAPMPRSDQPDYINGVVSVSSGRDPAELLILLHEIEVELGRTRDRINEARVIDLDLLAHGDRVVGWPVSPLTDHHAEQARAVTLTLPHPRLHSRAFVLLPLRDVAPDWRHPVSGQGVDAMIKAISNDSGPKVGFRDQICEPIS